MVKAVILVKSPKRLIAAKLRKISIDAFPVSGQFDAVLIVDVAGMSEVGEVVERVQKIGGVERTETMMEVQ